MTQNPDLFETFFETKDAELMQCVCDVNIRLIRRVEDVALMGWGDAHTVLVEKSEEATCKT